MQRPRLRTARQMRIGLTPQADRRLRRLEAETRQPREALLNMLLEELDRLTDPVRLEKALERFNGRHRQRPAGKEENG